jgi:hypothetical protein
MGREVIFGLGLNQLSDYCEERVPNDIQNSLIRTSMGSLIAGVISGYISHIPHNLSAIKLMEPHRSYSEIFTSLGQSHQHRVPLGLPPLLQNICVTGLTILMPKGVLIRTSQIVGSFVILNGMITALKDFAIHDTVRSRMR